MLAQSFLAAALIQAEWTVALIPAGAAVLLFFMIREPLVVVARQALVWQTSRPESGRAWRWLAVEAALLAGCGAWLARRIPLVWLAPLGLAALGLTLLGVWMIVRNRRRSIWLQIGSMAGLGGAAFLPPLVAEGFVPRWTWWLWGLLSVHSIAAVMVVHARLAMRTPAGGKAWKQAWAAQALPAAAAVACVAAGFRLAAAAPLLTTVAHILTLRGLRRPDARRVSITRVGIRALILSLAFTAIVVAGLWR